MNLTLTAEQELIAREMRRAFAEWFPLNEPNSTDPDGQWLASAAALGWLGISLPEAAGGAGYTLVEESLLAYESGRQLASLRLIANALGAHAAFGCGSEKALRNLLEGRASCALSFEQISASNSVERRHVYCADPAEYLLSITSRGAWFCESWEPVGAGETMCADRDVAIWFGPVRANAVKSLVPAQVYTTAALLIAGYATGMALAVRDMAVEYAKQREQFGVPIGSFQAVRHPCSLMTIRCEAALSQLYYAAAACTEAHSEAGWEARVSKLIALDAAEFCCRTNIQTHGGIGVTDQHPAPRFLKRLHVIERWLHGRERELQCILRHEQD